MRECSAPSCQGAAGRGVNRGDMPPPGARSQVKPSTAGWEGSHQLAQPARASWGSLVSAQRALTKTGHRSYSKKSVWNPGDFTCEVSQGSPPGRAAPLIPVSIWGTWGSNVASLGTGSAQPGWTQTSQLSHARTDWQAHASWMTDSQEELSMGYVPPSSWCWSTSWPAKMEGSRSWEQNFRAVAATLRTTARSWMELVFSVKAQATKQVTFYQERSSVTSSS